MNIKLVLKLVGRVLLLEAAALAVPLVVTLLYREDPLPFLLAIALVAAAGFGLSALPARHTFFTREGFVAVGLIWIFTGLVGALPFLFSGWFATPMDAIFESCSGFTTTGATILTEIESLPRGILLWRAQTQWMGGMGVLVLTLALLPKTGEGSVHLMRAESPGPIKTKLVPRVRDTAKILYSIYVGLTVLEIIFLMVAGMSLYDAVTHAMTTISTGGFSVKNASIAAYNSLTINWIIIVFMFLSGVNFSLLYYALCRNYKAVLHSEELRLYTLLTIGASALIAANLIVVGGQALNARTITDAVFQVVTVVTTTGYATVDFALWPTFSCMILFALMVTGACAGSTAGGVKSIRVILLVKNLRREVHNILHPRVVQTIRVDGNRVEENTLSGVSLFFFAYIALTLIGALVVAWDNVGFTEALSASMTCVGNVGPGLGALGPTGNFSGLSALSKIVLSFNMLLGRLEILPLLLMLFPSMWK